MARAHGAGLAGYLAAAYALLIVYASLHPFSGWRDLGAPAFEFLGSPWPRYYTWFDMLVNVLAYLPLGLHMVPALRERLRPAGAALLAVVAGAALSLALETLQNFLPTRVPSNLDLGCNTIGTSVGALLGLRYGRLFEDGGGLTRWRLRRFRRGRVGDVGLILIALWLLTQLNPEILLFGTGDLRSLVGIQAPLAFTAARIFAVELAVALLGVVATGALAWLLMRGRGAWLLIALFLLALAIRVFAAALILDPAQSTHWLTPGNSVGLVAGALLLPLVIVLPPQGQQMAAALALLGATALVNLAPHNPYFIATMRTWNTGHLLNFNGLTRLASSLWPFFALAYLFVLAQTAPTPPERSLG